MDRRYARCRLVPFECDLFQVEAVQHRPRHLVVDALAVTVDKFFSSAEASMEVELRKIEPLTCTLPGASSNHDQAQ
jgi:hypothetical protein